MSTKAQRSRPKYLTEQPLRSVKGGYDEPKNLDGLSSLFVVLARQKPTNLSASERVWLRALESHARNTKAVANPSLEQALAAERGLVGPLQPKQDRLVLEYLALPPVLAGARLYQEQAEIPAMREEPRNQRQQTVQPSYPAFVGPALDVRDGALGGLLHMRSVYGHRLRIVPQADDRD